MQTYSTNISKDETEIYIFRIISLVNTFPVYLYIAEVGRTFLSSKRQCLFHGLHIICRTKYKNLEKKKTRGLVPF